MKKGLSLKKINTFIFIISLFIIILPNESYSLPYINLWDVNLQDSPKRVINWNDTTSYLVFKHPKDSFIVYHILNHDTLRVDTIMPTTNIDENIKSIWGFFRLKVFNNSLLLETPSAGITQIKIFDASGRLVYENAFYSRGFNVIDLPRLSNGIYFALFNFHNLKAVIKFDVIHGKIVGRNSENSVENSLQNSPNVSNEYRKVDLQKLTPKDFCLSDTYEVYVRELDDTLFSPPDSIGQPWIGRYYDIHAVFPDWCLDEDTIDLLTIKFIPSTATDNEGHLYFPGGILQSLKALTLTDWAFGTLTRFDDNFEYNGERSSLPLRVATITGNGNGVPILDSIPAGYMEEQFWRLIEMVQNATDSLLPIVVVPFDSNMVSPPLPDTLPYSTLDGVPDVVHNAVIFIFGYPNEVSHPGVLGWTPTYYVWYPPDMCHHLIGAWPEITTYYISTPIGASFILAREFGRAIGLEDLHAPPPYVMARNGTIYTGTTCTFHHDELISLKLMYGLPHSTHMWYYIYE